MSPRSFEACGSFTRAVHDAIGTVLTRALLSRAQLDKGYVAQTQGLAKAIQTYTVATFSHHEKTSVR